MSERRVLFGKERECPVAMGRGEWSDKCRFRVIRDGLRSCIEALPVGERGLVARLQEVWAYCDSWQDDDGACGGQWPNLF